VQGDGGSACKLESHAKTQSRAFIQATPTQRLASSGPQSTFNLYLNMNLVFFSTTLHASSAWACPCIGPQMGPKCWRPQEAMGPAGGGIQGGRFGRPGHITKRALEHDQVLARTRFASADARLLAAKSARETQVPWTRLAGPRRLLPGPAKITDIPVRAAHGGARPTNDRDWIRSMASATCCRALVCVLASLYI
jgi:hypothetical protein